MRGRKWGAFHPCEFGCGKQDSTTDAGMMGVHRVPQGWARGLDTSVLAFDVAQFYQSVIRQILLGDLRRQGFSWRLVGFLGSYLNGRSTSYR